MFGQCCVFSSHLTRPRIVLAEKFAHTQKDTDDCKAYQVEHLYYFGIPNDRIHVNARCAIGGRWLAIAVQLWMDGCASHERC